MTITIVEPPRPAPITCCGTRPVIRRDFGYAAKLKIRMVCPNCRMHGQWARTVTRAIRNWNDKGGQLGAMTIR